MPADDIDELRITLRGPDGGRLSQDPEQETREPQPEAQTERRRQRAVEDCDRARRAAKKDRLGQRAMDRHREARKGIDFIHHTSTPPPKEKNDRKKELAAKAIDRPKTIWINLRNPPEVSPKASVKPVTMMMITGHDFGDGTFDRLQDLIEWLLPGHVRAGGPGRDGSQDLNSTDPGQHDATMSMEQEPLHDRSPAA